ncbi:DinB family protein [Actinoplanes sp. NBRC 103695]|uniref:DinB family protein n=1 Tax=Actinoplanes sp. NBRC 103695 TaxID=3032202 RepID=UPI0024A48975|nr:DinB family protein [Actinoplanes sp. NBRC 103695]GLZ01914.1 hypothetical protein Acsp02_91650 [Actinoplanes sp. NBRC 103695]
MSDERGDRRPPSINSGERETLAAFLDYLREAVIAKALGVDGARRPGAGSGISLLWLVKHLTAVEYNWFAWSYAAEDRPLEDDEAAVTDDDTPADLVAAYRAAAAHSNGIVARVADLSRPGARTLRETEPPSMRWVLVHLIEETARHAGHADILREQLDGAVGR